MTQGTFPFVVFAMIVRKKSFPDIVQMFYRTPTIGVTNQSRINLMYLRTLLICYGGGVLFISLAGLIFHFFGWAYTDQIQLIPGFMGIGVGYYVSKKAEE